MTRKLRHTQKSIPAETHGVAMTGSSNVFFKQIIKVEA
jgi:hypothetical protein